MKTAALVLSLSLISYLTSSYVFATQNCSSAELQLKNGEFQVTVLRYSGEPQSKKAIIIVPPTGGTNIIDKSYAKNFCKAGFDAYILSHWTDDDEYNVELEIHRRFYGRAQKAIATVLDSIESPFIGILGTSVGGLHAAIATSQFEKIKAAFIITGGAPIAEVIVTSDQKAMRDAKEKRRGLYGFKNDEEYLAALDKVIVLDPFKLPPHFAGKKLGMVIAQKDTTVPTLNQKKLQELWQPQAVISLSYNHFSAIVLTWLFHSDKIIGFFVHEKND